MWNQESTANYDGHASDAQSSYPYFNDSASEWEPPIGEHGRDRGTVQPSFDRYSLASPDHHIDNNGLDIFGNPSHGLQITPDAPASLSGSHNSSQFGLHENFYQDHPALTAEEFGYRSNSVASNGSISNNTNRYLYDRMSRDHSPSLEALSQNTSARIQSFESGMSGIGAAMLHSQGGDLRSSRHARRLYVGGIPQNQTSEEMLQQFFNDVCSKCLEEDNDGSYVISVYMNHKKCFAFVELKTNELTSACLELDGMIYCSNILKIQRANEYKPELMVNVPRTPIIFNLKKAPFPNKGVGNAEFTPLASNRIIPSNTDSEKKSMFSFQNASGLSSSVIRSCSIADIPRGALVLLGFPYDEGARRSGQMTGAAAGPRATRAHLYNMLGGGGGGGGGAGVINPEFGMDWSPENSGMYICDVGDVSLGLLLEEALARLGESIADIIRRGGVPLVLGGSGDMSYANAAGLMTVAGGNIGIISINSHLNVTAQLSESKIQATSASRLLLSDTRFCPPREGLMSEPWCDGKFVHVAAQGSLCGLEDVSFVVERGGRIVWLTRDIRQVNPFTVSSLLPCPGGEGQLVKHGSNAEQTSPGSGLGSGAERFGAHCCPSCHPPDRLVALLQPVLSQLKGASCKRPIYMSLHLEALHDSVLSGVSSRSFDGLSSQEATQICLLAGADENVALFDLCGLNPEVEEMKSPMLAAQLVYSFILGFLQRRRQQGRSQSQGQGQGAAKGTPPLAPPRPDQYLC